MRIELLTRAAGFAGVDEPQHAGYLPTTASSREEAVDMIEEYIEQFDRFGYKPENDHWWCRNLDDKQVTMLVIRG